MLLEKFNISKKAQKNLITFGTVVITTKLVVDFTGRSHPKLAIGTLHSRDQFTP